MTVAGNKLGAEPEIPLATDAVAVPVNDEDPNLPTHQPSATGESAAATTFKKSQQRTVDVIAPSDLPAGYQFYVNDATDPHRSLLVEVPPGGVRSKERFAAAVREEVDRGAHNVPTGRWRDGLCDCCRFGCCHPQCCLTFWCGPCALGQVLTRMKRNWCGLAASAQDPRTAFQVLFALYVVYLIVTWALGIVIGQFQAEDENGNKSQMSWRTTDNENDPDWLIGVRIVRNIVELALFIFMVVVVMRLRQYLRGRYRIREKSCKGCEDCCCAFWCQPCTICQMARHTADYQRYPAGCCTEDGLAGGAPSVV